MDSVTLVDLAVERDLHLLTRFYQELLAPNFGVFKDELDPIETWVECISHPEKNGFEHHVLLAFDKSDVRRERLLGGAACEYYRRSNVALLSYFAVASQSRGKGLGKHLIRRVLRVMDREAQKAGHRGIDMLVCETNSAEKVSADRDSMDPKLRHRILGHLGFAILDLDYVQPALDAGNQKCTNLLLCAHERFIHRGQTPQDSETVSSAVVAAWLEEFFRVLMGKRALRTDPDYLRLRAVLSSQCYVRVMRPPR